MNYYEYAQSIVSVIPRFEVNLEGPQHILRDDSTIRGAVSAKYISVNFSNSHTSHRSPSLPCMLPLPSVHYLSSFTSGTPLEKMYRVLWELMQLLCHLGGVRGSFSMKELAEWCVEEFFSLAHSVDHYGYWIACIASKFNVVQHWNETNVFACMHAYIQQAIVCENLWWTCMHACISNKLYAHV